MGKTIYQVDAFTSTPFKGNPAGVMIWDTLPTEEYMHNIAMEMNLSETAFLSPDNGRFKIRFYTPEKEIDLCGHATLSSAHILFEQGMAADNIEFISKAGPLHIRKEGDLIVMNFPKYSYSRREIPEELIRGAGFTPQELYDCDYDWKLALLKDEMEVRDARPDFNAIREAGFGDLMITAPSSSREYDFVVRCFVPEMGIDEDPVTGSAHCALTPFWSEKLGRKSFRSYQASARGGYLDVSIKGDRVEIAGTAVTVMKGEFLI
ncbi:MAG: PhzF family phenazine biosynthesis protein [Bacteroidales bacterium]|nr:PhzF family phenazine biosynthesis protein [Bacteroidales bacterium]